LFPDDSGPRQLEVIERSRHGSIITRRQRVPGFIVVGEVRQQECLDLLIALNSGIPGNAEAHMN
jgi:hypothetical protein